MTSQLEGKPTSVVNLVREEERVRRLHTEALGRYNYLKQQIGNKKAEAGASFNDAAYIDESFDVEEKNAELHILANEATIIYYYYEQGTRSWLFLERDRLNSNGTMYAIQRKTPNSLPHVQVSVT